jgi:hypothetical protein
VVHTQWWAEVMIIVEKEVTRWEVLYADIANVYRADRDDDIQLWWTPVDELKAFALNVFSPRERIFWNFSQYEAFGAGKFEYMQRVQSIESTVGILNELIRDVGAELKSEVASRLFGGFTRYFGDKYHPKHQTQPAFRSGGRHFSIAVPDSCQPMVSRYFQEQVRVFGDSATRQCPEDVSRAYDDESDRTLSGLLVKGVFLMKESERNAHLALIRSRVDLLADDKPEQFCFTGNAIALSAFGIEPDCEWLDDFSEIARFRVEMAIRHYSLSRVEKLKRDLDSSEWGLLRLADLRDELRGRLATVLARYPVIETNPFEQWNCKP